VGDTGALWIWWANKMRGMCSAIPSMEIIYGRSVARENAEVYSGRLEEENRERDLKFFLTRHTRHSFTGYLNSIVLLLFNDV